MMEAKTQTPTVQESTIVERVARIVSSVRGSKPDYTLLAAELEPAIPFDVFGVVLLRHDRQAVRVTACQCEDGFWRATYHQHPLEGSKVAQLLRTPVTSVTNYPAGLDGTPAECGDALCGRHQIHATLIAPLIVGERILGTLELGSTILDAYAASTLQRLIGAVVRVLAAAIDSAQVGGSAEIQDRQRQALKDVSSALTSTMDLSSILTQIVEGVASALNVASAIVTFDQGRLRLRAQSGLDPAALQSIVGQKEVLSDQSIIGYTLHRRQPCVSNDIYTDERFSYSSSYTTELGIHSIFSHPLVTGTTVYGALLLCSSEPGGFTPLKADILSLFASQATIAIHNGMLIESAHQRRRFQKAIEQLEHSYGDNGNEQELLARVRQEAEHTFGVSISSLLRFISDHLLTRSEGELQAMLETAQLEELPRAESAPATVIFSPVMQEFSGRRSVFNRKPEDRGEAGLLWQDGGVELLTQTAEEALVRAEVVSDLGRFLTQLNQSAGHDALKDSWFVLDLNGRCLYMNPVAEDFCGLSLGVAAARTLEDIFSGILLRTRNAEELHLYLQECSQGMVNRKDMRCVLAIKPVLGQANVAGMSTRHANVYESEQKGRLIHHPSLLPDSVPSDYHYQLSRYPLYNQHNEHIAYVLQIHNVTEQVHEEKNKSVLLSSVSHDLRTPLTTIKMAVTGLLQEGVEWDESMWREILEEIDTEADHLGVLVHALVEMSRIEMGALVLEKEWCDIVEIAHGAMRRLERALLGRAVRLEVQPNLPLVYVDHVQLERVFYNLLENAVRHSPEEQGILLSFATTAESVKDALHQSLCVKVIDHGQEVPAGERDHIFKTFYGLNLRGSGLGLAICRGIVEAHQGHIGVETAPCGEGSCFVFTLPIHTYNGVPIPASGVTAVLTTGEITDGYMSNISSSLQVASQVASQVVSQVASNGTSTIAPTMEVQQ